MTDTNGHIKDTMDIKDENTVLLLPDHLTSGVTADSERISTSTIFNLVDRLPIFSYLVNSNRIRWYRVIMRFFFQSHRELYRYQLTAQEVRDAIRATLDAEYTLEQCQNDLAALKEWGNITTIYDSSRDRKSTRLNSSHQIISYAVFCLKKKH